MWRFVKAVLAGALASAILPMLLTIGLAIMTLEELMRGSQEPWRVAYLAIVPLIVATPAVFVSALVIGVPTATFLRSRGWESREAYVSTGTVVGAIIPPLALALMHAPSGYWLSMLGAFGGGVTAYAWWSNSPASKGR